MTISDNFRLTKKKAQSLGKVQFLGTGVGKSAAKPTMGKAGPLGGDSEPHPRMTPAQHQLKPSHNVISREREKGIPKNLKPLPKPKTSHQSRK